jgi:hypothetical protein
MPHDILAAYVHKCCRQCIRQIALVWRLPDSSGSPQFFCEERRGRVSSFSLYSPWLGCKNWNISYSKFVNVIWFTKFLSQVWETVCLFPFWWVELEPLWWGMEDICRPWCKFSTITAFIQSCAIFINVNSFVVELIMLTTRIAICPVWYYIYFNIVVYDYPKDFHGVFKKKRKAIYKERRSMKYYLQNARRISTSTPENRVALLLIMFNMWVL